MGIDVATAAVVFGTIFVVELPDKTFIATLVMSTRWRPLLVWIGVSLAFFVQTAVAVLAGGLISRLPRTWVEVAACLMFLLGGILLLRGAGQADAEEAGLPVFLAWGVGSGDPEQVAADTRVRQIAPDRLWVVLDPARKHDDTKAWVTALARHHRLDAYLPLAGPYTASAGTVGLLGLPRGELGG